MTGNFKGGLIGELGAITLGLVSVQVINNYLEMILLTTGIISSIYGLIKFIKASKKHP